MNLPASWPVNYPAECKQSCPLYVDRQAKSIIKMLEPGDAFRVIEKEVLDLLDLKNTGRKEIVKLIRIQLPKLRDGTPGPWGYTLRTHIDIGTTVDMDTPITLSLPPRPPPPVLVWDDHGSQTPQDTLGQTILGLVDQNYKQREALPTYNQAMNDLSTLGAREEVANTIYKGFKKISAGDDNLVTILNRRDFHVRHLQRIPEITEDGPLPCGIQEDSNILYTEILSDFRDQPERRPENYGGRTSRPRRRKKAHNDAAEDVLRNGIRSKYRRSAHYQASAAARKRRMVPVCILPQEYKYTFLAEQILNQLFQLYTRRVLDFGRSTGDVEEINTGVAKYWIDSDLANMLQNIASGVFRQTGWPGAVNRAAGSPSFGSSVGLMWKSPIADANNHLSTLYTQYTAGEYLLFRRSPLVCRPDSSSKTSLGGQLINYQIEDFPVPPGTLMHPVIEVTRSGQAHPFCWARIPKSFGTNDVALANSWALRLDWLDGSIWKSVYVQSCVWSVPTGPVCSVAPYVKGIQINHFFRERTFVPDARLDFLDGNTPRLRSVVVEINNLTRTLRIARKISNLQPTNIHPRLLEPHEVKKAYEAAALSETFFSYDASPKIEKACDTCRAIRHEAKSYNCHESAQGCQTCLGMNSKCTYSCAWAPGDRAARSQALKRTKLGAYLSRPDLHDTIYMITDPGLETLDL